MRRLLLQVLALTFATCVLPATAQATPSSFVAMLSDPYDWIGGGGQRLYYPGNATIAIHGNAGDLTVSVSGGALGDSYSMEFAAARGQSLRPGRYVDAQRAPFRDAGRPGIDISGDGRGCNRITGLFEVKDIGSDSRGAVNRLWLLYEQHCEGYRSALFGEIKLGEPPAADPALVMPLTLRWPASDVGRTSTVVPVTIVANGAPVTVTSASVVGSNPPDFAIRSDECSGRTLNVGASCQ